MHFEQFIGIIIKCLHFLQCCIVQQPWVIKSIFSLAAFTKPPSAFLVARQPLRGGVEHKFKGAAQLPDQLMTNVKVPVMSTIDYAFLLSPDLTLQTLLQERDQRHTCTKPSPPLSVFCSLIPGGGFCAHLLHPGFTDNHIRSHTFSCPLIFAPCSLSHPCPPSLSFLLIIALIT